MTRLCIRLPWIVSPSARQCRSFATAPGQRSIISRRVLRPIQHTQSQFFSAFASRPGAHASLTMQSAAKLEPPLTVKYEHTVAQIARATSQAVRVAIHEHNFQDAFYVANSALIWPLEPRITPPKASRRLLNPMNFGRPIPTRLVVHTLIHALLREGHTIRAGQEIQKLIAIGVRFRHKTMEASVGQLCSKSSPRFPGKYQRTKKPSGNDWNVCRMLQAESVRLTPETHLALDLLSAARRSRHRRTERMYSWLVDACLLQGEIFVATLLFVVLVKDWQLRTVMRSSTVDTERPPEDTDADHVICPKPDVGFRDLRKRSLATEIGIDARHFTIPYPERSMLQSILNCIDRSIFPSGLHTISETTKLDCEKSLSYLANLVDQRCLPFGQLSPLLRALYSSPISRNKIHILEDGRHFHANIYQYSHQVLLELCQSLPSQRPMPSRNQPDVLPPLDTRAYNSLIHYALRHRLSPALADTVIEHMTIYRKPPLQPDITTYNILLHSASSLRNSGLANQVLDTLRERHDGGNHRNPKDRPSRTISSSPEQFARGGNFLRHATERLTVPAIQTPSNDNGHYAHVRPIHADVYTLCTYITHLVRTGRPEVVADIIFHILPELRLVSHPATSLSECGYDDDTQDGVLASRRESMRRAIEYGPYLFSALLNALQKAGKTGLAERVWLLARRAERASWIQPESGDAPAPWCLPIHAYTSMMQCYANESKKGAVLIRGSRYSRALSSSLSLMQERRVWEPQQQLGRTYVKGWAYFHLKMQAREKGFRSAEPPLRSQTAREVGYLLFKSMRSGAMSVWQELMTLQSENMRHLSPEWATTLNSLKLPVGDARFFNAVLDMFGRRTMMQKRRVHASPSWWNRKLRIAQQVYRESGWTPMMYDHTLVEIALAMAQSGYALPLGLQRALVGRVTSRVLPLERQEHEVRPFAFPRPTNLRHRMFSLAVTKSRGLPLGRRKPEIMRRGRIQARREAMGKAQKL